MLDTTYELIVQLDLDISKQTLCVWDCPAGHSKTHLEVVSKKMEEWVINMKNVHLSSHMAWMTHELKLWSGIWYVIGTMNNNIYEHVDPHMGRKLLWHQLALPQQLNVFCNNLAKSAVL